MAIIAIQALVEDIISASGKGTLTGLIYFSVLIICEMHGRRLHEEYEVAKPEGSLPVGAAPALTK